MDTWGLSPCVTLRLASKACISSIRARIAGLMTYGGVVRNISLINSHCSAVQCSVFIVKTLITDFEDPVDLFFRAYPERLGYVL